MFLTPVVSGRFGGGPPSRSGRNGARGSIRVGYCFTYL